jgi:Protein of unknown function (DUF2934)
MKRSIDYDGKSQAASAVDRPRYPGPDESSAREPAGTPTHQEIAARAHQLWLQEGQPPESAERNWLDAERELKEAAISRRLIEMAHQGAGSVQR